MKIGEKETLGNCIFLERVSETLFRMVYDPALYPIKEVDDSFSDTIDAIREKSHYSVYVDFSGKSFNSGIVNVDFNPILSFKESESIAAIKSLAEWIKDQKLS